MLKFAWRNLINRPVRTILSVLGLSVAIAGMVGLFAISGGIQYLVNKTFEKIPGYWFSSREPRSRSFPRSPAPGRPRSKRSPAWLSSTAR